MASQLVHTPHVTHVQSGNNKYDPLFSSLFEVMFSFPASIANPADIAILTEQVTEISGLDALQKTPAAGSQKFLGADVSFLNPTLDNTYAELTITLNLNLRNDVDAFVLKAFKEWASLGYNLSTGVRTLKRDYVADSLIVNVANRAGDIWRNVTFRDVILTGITGLDSLNYTNNDAATLQVTIRADWWEDVME